MLTDPASLASMPVPMLAYCTPRTGLVLVSGPDPRVRRALLASMFRTAQARAQLALPFDPMFDGPVPLSLAGPHRGPLLLAEDIPPADFAVAVQRSVAGPAVYASLAAMTLADLMEQAIAMLAPASRSVALLILAHSLRLAVVHAPVGNKSAGRRRGCPEYLAFDDAVRSRMLDGSVRDWTALLGDLAQRVIPLEEVGHVA